MRLFELIQEDPFDVKDYTRSRVPTTPLKPLPSEDTEQLGAGWFSKALTHKDLPQDVLKMTIRDGPRDAYETFLRALASDPEMRDNIHMPRIRSAKVITTPSGEKSLMVRVERLESVSNLSERDAYELAKKLVGRETAHKLKNEPSYRVGTLKETPWVGALLTVLDYLFQEEIAPREILDDELRNAYIWAKKKGAEIDVTFDLHLENWMIRRTPYGPQLVINDPFSYNK